MNNEFNKNVFRKNKNKKYSLEKKMILYNIIHYRVILKSYRPNNSLAKSSLLRHVFLCVDSKKHAIH